MFINALKIPLSVVIEGANLILVEVAPYYKYEDGKKTDTLDGYRYTVVEDKKFEKFSVKISSSTPAISNEQIETAKSKIMVSFENCIAKPYRTASGDYALSFSATSVSIIK